MTASTETPAPAAPPPTRAMNYGERFAEAVRDYLVANRLFRSDGRSPSLGKINGRILGELANSFKAKWDAHEKAKKARKKPVKQTNGPECQIPPTVEMVKARIAEMGYTFNAATFIAHYTANGWKVGKTRMINWHAACVTWQGDMPRRNVNGSAKHVTALIPEPPPGWRDLIRTDEEDGRWADSTWDTMLPFYQQRILRKLAKMPKPGAGEKTF